MSPRLADGRDASLARTLARAFQDAVRRPHMTTDVRQDGYGPATFDVAIIEPEGVPSGRFARVTIEMVRDADRAERLRREMQAND